MKWLGNDHEAGDWLCLKHKAYTNVYTHSMDWMYMELKFDSSWDNLISSSVPTIHFVAQPASYTKGTEGKVAGV